jgi:hypothetical protein
MERINDIRHQLTRIASIRYENPNGGPYAYLQFLAYSRELLRLIKPLKRVEKQADRLEAAGWMLNEYLGVRFTHAQQVIFENQLRELMPVFSEIEQMVSEVNSIAETSPAYFHTQVMAA